MGHSLKVSNTVTAAIAKLKPYYGNFGANLSRTKRADRGDSIQKAVDGFQGAITDIPLPQGVELRTDEEYVLWGQYSRAREAWREMDLLLLVKIVQMEADIRGYKKTLDRSGVLIQNKRGTLVPNPLLTVIDTLERRQLAVIRSMSLNQQASDPRTLNGSAKTEEQARVAMKNQGLERLIAMPKH